MAAPGKGLATLLEVDGFDPYRVYSEDPQAGGWREHRNPIGGGRYWRHVGMRLTTWSLVELLRFNGLEEFLLLGEWGVFVAVPEDGKTYEDVTWGLSLYDNDRLQGVPVEYLPRGQVLVSLGFCRPGVMELLLQSAGEVVRRMYAPYKVAGKRVVQRLPVREHNDDLTGMAAVTVPMFRVRPESEDGSAQTSALVVTADRDPRSPILGHVKAGTKVGLACIIGTRAQLARIPDGPRELWGGWISFLLLDGTATLERILEVTENMKLAGLLKAHLDEIEAMRTAAIANGEDPDQAPVPPRPTLPGMVEEEKKEENMAVTKSASAEKPPVRSKVPLASGMDQRPTVTGGWRMVIDKAWFHPTYIAPIGGRMTWGLSEVMRTGGLDDLLLARQWDICVVDPLALEIMKDKTWHLKVYSDPAMSGQPFALFRKGTLIVTQIFHTFSQTVRLLVPPTTPDGDWAIGYAYYQLKDGRHILRAMQHQAEVDEPEEGMAELGFAEPPENDLLEGPYYAEPAGGEADLMVTTGQDVGSDRWARLPRGYCVGAFEEVLGYRARLPDLEGGGWVNLLNADGASNFWKTPGVAPVLELPEQVAAMEEEDLKLPIVWPGLGVFRPPLPVKVIPHVPATLPTLLQQMGGSRTLCDWDRICLKEPRVLDDEHEGFYVWMSPLTSIKTTLHDLLKHNVWKIGIVEAESLPVRQLLDPRSPQLGTLPRGSLVVCEWVSTNSSVRVVWPGKTRNPKPIHAWADLPQSSGAAAISQLVPGGAFWIEPRGGHLPEEEQRDPDWRNILQLRLRCGKRGSATPRGEETQGQEEPPDEESPEAGKMQRGDGVELAQLAGRFARVTHVSCISPVDEAPAGGWIDLFDEVGWSVLRVRYPGEHHPAEDTLPKVIEEPDLLDDEQAKRGLRGRRRRGDCTDTSSDAGAELPALLLQIGELEANSIWTRDWREAVDPVWGQRYYVNRWSGQIIHSLSNYGVACPAVRLTVWFSNLSLEPLRAELGDETETRIGFMQRTMLPCIAGLADVDEDRMEFRIFEGHHPDLGGEDEEEEPAEDSIMGSRTQEDANGFRVQVLIRAPGVRSSWASGAIKRAMADNAGFQAQMKMMLGAVPDILTCRVNIYDDIAIVKAELEELDIPRVANVFKPPPPPPPPPPLPVAEEFAELRRSYLYTKQSRLHFHCKKVGVGDSMALADGLEGALRECPTPPLEELGMWGCGIGDGGICAVAKALDRGCGANLHTLLLDECNIGAAGATALGIGLKSCKQLRELGMSKNPIADGTAFAKLVAGLNGSLVLLDATETMLNDAAARGMAAALRRFPMLKALRLGGNSGIGLLGVEALLRALLGAPSVKLLDLKGSDDEGDWPRLKRVLQDGGVDLSRFRLH